MRKITSFLFGFLACLYGPPAHTAFYKQHADGWHWYEEFQRQKETQTPSVMPPQATPSSATHQLHAFKKKVEELKAIAVINPTFENVRAYMEIQKELLDRASRFAQKWLEVVYLRPELDYTLTHPTSQASRHVYLDEKRREMEARIKALSKTHGLFFFFSSGCAYCRQFAPIVKGFSQKYGWQVLAISMDGSKLPEFPHAEHDNGTASNLGVKALPALLAVSPTSGQIIPLSYGMSTHDQIEDRVRVLLLRRTP